MFISVIYCCGDYAAFAKRSYRYVRIQSKQNGKAFEGSFRGSSVPEGPFEWHEFQGGIFSIGTDSQTVDYASQVKINAVLLIEIRPGGTIELVHRSAKQ